VLDRVTHRDSRVVGGAVDYGPTALEPRRALRCGIVVAMLLALFLACRDPAEGDAERSLAELPAPDDWSTRGPGGPARAFVADELLTSCAWLNGGEGSAQHHNLVGMHDGWLMFPWAPEDGGGGISFFDVPRRRPGVPGRRHDPRRGRRRHRLLRHHGPDRAGLGQRARAARLLLPGRLPAGLAVGDVGR
jgi:hypothetical protein